MSDTVSFNARSSSVRHGLLCVPVPQEDEHPLSAALRPLTTSRSLKPLVVTVMLHDAVRDAPTESWTVSVILEAAACGFGHRTSPVSGLIVMPVGALLSE